VTHRDKLQKAVTEGCDCVLETTKLNGSRLVSCLILYIDPWVAKSFEAGKVVR
jgi:hypothetical protein